jgi:hypothetical protein|tara:strand:- start:213 stop:518 length:306 start_codon:yes stop_codon:yes gene_type:complete
MTNEKDHVADIMKKWYDAMEKNKVMVQPKASTILGTILADYAITLDTSSRDIWAEALTIKGGEFQNWYAKLTPAELLQYDEGRKRASETYDSRYNKQLLKG